MLEWGCFSCMAPAVETVFLSLPFRDRMDSDGVSAPLAVAEGSCFSVVCECA